MTGHVEARPAAVTPEVFDEWDSIHAVDADALVYPDVRAFVEEHLVLLVRRQLGGGLTWCASWWRHAEAISRLEALWRAWEELRREPTLGMSLWWRDHADHHLSVLFSRDAGPFAACTADRHEDLPPLPTAKAAADWWGVPDPGTGEGVADTAGAAPEAYPPDRLNPQNVDPGRRRRTDPGSSEDGDD